MSPEAALTARERRWVPLLFVATLLGAPLQWYAKYRTGDEPYPGLFMPGFGNPAGSGDTVSIVRDRFIAYYPGGDSRGLTRNHFLEPIPRSHHASFVAAYLRDPAASTGAAARERIGWVRTRLREIAPRMQADSLEVITERLILAPFPDSTVVPVSRHVLRFGQSDP